MKKASMHSIKTVLAIILFAALLMSCATGDRMKTDTDKSQKFRSIKNIAVQTFSCPDPVMANDVRNIIIAYLLNNYSVIIGEKADVVISGTITLHSKPASSAPSVRAAGRAKEISAEIMHNGKIMDSVAVAESSAYGSLEAMGSEIAKQISGKLSKMSSSYP